MSTVFKIAAGVLLGLLAYQIIIYQQVDYQQAEYKKQIALQQAEYENQRKKATETQTLRTNLNILTNAISSYYRKNKKLPTFVSDLHCSGYSNKWSKLDCAAVYDIGIFYVSHEDEWASVEPYILDGKLYNKCETSTPLSSGSKYSDCSRLDISSIPEKKYPPFDCTSTADDIEKIICKSDKLIANEIKLSLAYKSLLQQNTADKKQQIIDDKNNFINQRRATCSTSTCVEEMTSKKILRLEFLGVWKKV